MEHCVEPTGEGVSIMAQLAAKVLPHAPKIHQRAVKTTPIMSLDYHWHCLALVRTDR
jgi:hypothetical protein